MSIEVLWTLPVRGDGRSGSPTARTRAEFVPGGPAARVGAATDLRPGRFTAFDYLTQVARAADLAGYDGVVVPYDPAGEESWVVAAALAREARHVRLVTEIQPGFGTAVYAAKLALSFQRFFGDRLGWKLAVDVDPERQRAVGDFVDGDDRVARAAELLTVSQGVWNDGPFDFNGRFFEVEQGGFFDPSPSAAVLGGQSIARRPFPTVYLDGTTPAQLELSARFADVHLFDLAPVGELADAIALHRALAADWGRTVRYGVRTGVVSRDRTDEAWRRAGRLAAAGGGAAPIAEPSAIWSGYGALDLAAPTALVGSHDEVADELVAIAELGVSIFLLDATPRLEEAYRLGEELVPRLRRRVAALAPGPAPVAASAAAAR